MTSINEPAPIPQIRPSFKANEQETNAAIENNEAMNKMAKAATVSSIAAVATLIPLTILAVKNHQLTKTVQSFEEKLSAKAPKIPEDIKKNITEGTDALKQLFDNLSGITKDNKENVAKLIDTINTKLKSTDIEKKVSEIFNDLVEKGKLVSSEAKEAFINDLSGKLEKLESESATDKEKALAKRIRTILEKFKKAKDDVAKGDGAPSSPEV